MFYCGLQIAHREPEKLMEQTPGPLPTQKTILLVDDDAGVQASVSRNLKDYYNILIASSGVEALQRSRDFAGEIHLLLTDFVMAGMNGVELASRITIQRPEIKVLLMSGYANGTLALNEGWHFLTKPFNPLQLRLLIADLISSGPMLHPLTHGQ
jgi:two-component system cell cycle sensor histidine kinase/response regulator CckA